jgi:hypothetical protein
MDGHEGEEPRTATAPDEHLLVVQLLEVGVDVG